MNTGTLIVSRHAAAIEFIRAESPEFADAKVIAIACPADVAGNVVAGNLPLHLAALAAEVVAVEFDGTPPRGTEYGVAEMLAAGAKLRRYTVRESPSSAPELVWASGHFNETDCLVESKGRYKVCNVGQKWMAREVLEDKLFRNMLSGTLQECLKVCQEHADCWAKVGAP